MLQRAVLVLGIMLFAACSRGPDVPRLEQDVQARVDTLFGRQVLKLESLRRQGSAPYAAAADGARQVVVYYNAVSRVVGAYDPSDWQGLSPTMIANALGAADEGVTGLRSGPNAPGTRLRGYGSIVYRRDGKQWRPATDLVPRAAATAAASAVAAPKSQSSELVRRLAPRAAAFDATVAAAVSPELMPALRLADPLSEFPVVGGHRFALLGSSGVPCCSWSWCSGSPRAAC